MKLPLQKFKIQSSKFKVIIFLLLTFNFVLLIFPYPVYALGAISTGTPVDSSNYDQNVHTGNQWQVLGDQIVGCGILGSSILATGVIQCPQHAQDGSLKVWAYLPGGGAIGGLTKVMTAMYTPPTSSGLYLADLGSGLGIAKPAYAQGVGGSGDLVLLPILNLWKMMRNIAYLAFILVFIVVGLMIMFRQKLNPQTVISVQAALPGLVIGLILVTFSYFIAALIVDFSFVGMSLVTLIFRGAGLDNIINDAALSSPNNALQLANSGNIFGLFFSFIANTALFSNIIVPLTQLGASLGGPIGSVVGNLAGVVTTGPIGVFFVAAKIVGLNIFDPFAAVGNLFGQLAGGSVGEALGYIVTLIFIIALFIQMVRLVWALVAAYITILVFTIAGPLLIVLGSIPGRGAMITYWWKTILGNILIFPTVYFVFLFAGTFLAAGNTGDFSHTLPLFAGLPTSLLKALIGYGLVLGSPAVPGMVKKALGVSDLTAIQQAAFEGGGAAIGLGMLGVNKSLEPLKMRRQAVRETMMRQRFGNETAVEMMERGQVPWYERPLGWRKYKPPARPSGGTGGGGGTAGGGNPGDVI